MKTLILIYILLVSPFLEAQELRWRVLPNSINTTTRIQDISFVNSLTGWAVASFVSNGTSYFFISKTTDGGATWQDQADPSYTNYRCVGFADSLNGWIGVLGNATQARIIKTTNGGTNWMLSLATPPADSNGVCGLYVVNKDIVYGVGRWYGPARFYKTTNGGLNWAIKDMSQYAKVLIDCHFFSADSGIAVGGIGNSQSALKGIVLFTSDGGETWVNRFTTTAINQWGWKISFPSRNTGYVSLERELPGTYFLKTTNGGLTWEEKPFLNETYTAQGIGFVNENTGWIGGDDKTYKTVNGGKSWFEDSFGSNVNRFRFINDTLGYSAGWRVYKYSKDSTVSINPVSATIPVVFKLEQNYPNPFNPGTKIRFDVIPAGAEVKLDVINTLGQIVETLVDGKLTAGTYEVEFKADEHPPGVYYYRLITFDYTDVKKMVLIK